MDGYFTAGFYLGNLAFLGMVALVFWFVGRWGWIGLLIRVVCAAVFLIRVVNLIALMSPSA